ncbi:MAG TPA: redoxin domain-containing protein [Solirubrobacteraceae bacterium]|jgi:cytochrome c biogenesis protein CcdA/thiol-disulfide isomerase/thioredoxin|nr:redoxin domain-containing protein [Solirubrobacteraceae bacterium]
MLLLIGFAVLAGAGTALSPCVLPLLPALLSAGGVGGRRRPLGVVLGLTVTFTIAIVGVADVVGGVGLGADPLRYIAIGVLLAAGLVLLVPSVGDRLEARMSRVAALGAGGARGGGGDGFRSGLLVGGALGLVYTPCAGPILAAVISVGAVSGRSVVVAIAYSLGSAAVLLALTLGGRTLFDRVRAAGRGPALQRTLGAVLLITAVAMIAGADVRFDQYVAEHIPEVNLTAGLEKSKAVESRLREITGRRGRFAQRVGEPAIAPKNASDTTLLADARGLKDLGKAPEFHETQRWFNTGADKPVTLASLRGRVVLVDFWTYTCINCIRTLPYLEAWDAAYRRDGLTIVGVHTPEFAFEHEASNVQSAIERFGIHYPVVQDNDMGTWNAYGNQYWPADYLIDARGHVRYAVAGEGDYGQTETAIRALLAEAGHEVGGMSRPTGVIAPSEVATPETYLGTNRAQGWRDGPHEGTHDYGAPPAQLSLNEFAFSGTWEIAGQPAAALADAGVDLEFEAKNVYLVLSSQGELPRSVRVLLDGRPIPAREAGADVHGSAVTVRSQRLYSLVSLPGDRQHRLSLRFSPGVSGYAFTFG